MSPLTLQSRLFKVCNHCKELKPLSDFCKNKTQKDGYNAICKDCTSKNHATYYRSHREQEKRAHINYKQKLKVEVFTHYGKGKCACIQCGFTDLRALSIDHLNGGGNAQRRLIHAANFYVWLKNNDYPEGYQTLCMNCQWIKRLATLK